MFLDIQSKSFDVSLRMENMYLWETTAIVSSQEISGQDNFVNTSGSLFSSKHDKTKIFKIHIFSQIVANPMSVLVIRTLSK